MRQLTVLPSEFARTFTLIARPDTHDFIVNELPAFRAGLAHGATPLRRYIERLRSGEYIPKASYADAETDFVYMTIGQFSGAAVSFEGLTFLDPAAGKDYEHLALEAGDIIVTRSGTVGVSHVFEPPDEKTYIPSHHLAVIAMREDADHSREYLRLVLQAAFARRYFWAFASGKGQKEISNWSIKSLPVPDTPDPHEVASRILAIEREVADLQDKVAERLAEKEQALVRAVNGEPPALDGGRHPSQSPAD